MKKLRKYKPRICVKCDKEYIPTGNRQRYCAECGKIHELEYNRRHTRERYYIDGVGEAQRLYNKRYRVEHTEEIKERKKKYYEEHKEEITLRKKKYYEENREEILRKKKEYTRLHPEVHKAWCIKNKEHRTAQLKQYRQRPEVKERYNAQERARNKDDPNYKMARWARIQLRRCLHSEKDVQTFNFLDYSPAQLREHIEQLWESWMNWDNYGIGRGKWNIDHIRPLASFQFINEDGTINFEVLRIANSLENLRPIEAIDNIIKRNKWDKGMVNGEFYRRAN